MDRQMYRWTENHPILQDFIPYWGCCPATAQLQPKKYIKRGKGTADQMPLGDWFHFVLVTCLILIHSPQPDNLNLYSMPKFDIQFHPRLSFIFVLVCQLCLSRFDFTAHIWRPQIPSLDDHLCPSLALNCHQVRNLSPGLMLISVLLKHLSLCCFNTVPTLS